MDLGRAGGSFKISKGKDNEGRERGTYRGRQAGRQVGRKEGDRRCAAVDGQFLNANNGGVERGGLANENAGRRWYANRKLLRASSSPSA